MSSPNLTPEYRHLSALMQSRRSMRSFKKQELDDDTIRTWYRLYQQDGFDGLVSFGYDGE